MPLIFNKALNLTEPEVRYAMANSTTNAAAARFIGCHVSTYKRYATRYIDPETGLSLWALHANQGNKGGVKYVPNHHKRIDIFDVLDGKHPSYDRKLLRDKLIKECIFAEECAICGFNERRFTDDTVPLVLLWKDGDLRNHKKENLEFICYNCYYLTYGNVFFRTIEQNHKRQKNEH